MVILNNINLSFQENKVLENFSAHILCGEKVCISGPSGKGKSSLLKIMQGYILPNSGKATIAGLDFNQQNIKAIRSKIAYVPQNIHLPVSNGLELIHLLAKSEIENQVLVFLNKLGLSSDMFYRLFDEMSGGQKQRIVIAVCLALNREILLLDEPTASLDDEAITALIQCISELKGTTVISASHNERWINASQRTIIL